MPFYTRMERSIGNQIFVWTQSCFDNTLFITGLELAHKELGHKLYRDPVAMAKEGYESVTLDSPKIKLVMWVKRDLKKMRGLRSLEVSMSMVDENRNVVEGFEKMEPCMDEFDLPDISLWTKKVKREWNRER